MISVKDLNIDLFQQLSEAFGPSGYESRTIKIIREHMAPFCDDYTHDKTGSFIFRQRGNSADPVILVAGHVDEIGFIVTAVISNGFLCFHPIGAWSSQTLLGQRVVIRTRQGQKITGVICSKPLLFSPDKQQMVRREEMYIDIGVTCKEEALDLGIRIGDPVVPYSHFQLTLNGKIAMGKAFDDRVGVFVVMELLRFFKELGIAHPNTIAGAATVQEEVGIRGARTTVATVKPDLAFAIDIDLATDIPGIPESQSFAKLGQGVSILVYDGTMIPNIFLREFVINQAEAAQIPHQLSATACGGTDAGVFHLYERGCPSLSLGLPCRHIHTPVSLVSLEDVASAINLLLTIIPLMDRERVQSFTNYPAILDQCKP